MDVVWLIVLGAAVAVFVSRPLWPGAEASRAEDPEVAALQAARESKYREIRDAKIDRDSGKLPEEDFEVLNAELRREAIEILDRLERAGGEDDRARGGGNGVRRGGDGAGGDADGAEGSPSG